MTTIKLGIKRDLQEFAFFCTEMAQLNPSGFRKPGRKFGSTSLVEQAAIRAGHMDAPALERSKRGERKEAARLDLLASRDKLIEEGGIPDKYRNSYRRRMDRRFGRLVVT